MRSLPLLLAIGGCGSAEPPEEEPPPPAPDSVRFEILEATPTPSEQPPTTGASTRLADGRFITADPGRQELVLLDGSDVEIVDFDGRPVRVAELRRAGTTTPSWVVADIGILWPSESPVGRVLLQGDGGWEVLLADVGRVVCAEPGDLDGDGDEDLAVCEFGHLEGGLSWLEQTPEGWTRHRLHERPGTIRAIPADIDGDGDLDLTSVLSQTDEQVLLHRNDGKGLFTAEILFDSERTDWGLSGLEVGDVDGDGDVDLVVTNGDSMDLTEPATSDPYTWHGIHLFRNDGTGRFETERLASLWGAYAPVLADLDRDGDTDLFVGAYQVPTLFPDATIRNAIWLEQTPTGFTTHDIPDAPPQLMAAVTGDINEDGRPDVLAGTLYMNGPDFGKRLVWLINRAD